jgi:hypothetical protein
MQKIHNLQKNPLKRNPNPSRYYYYYYCNSIITNLKSQHKSKISYSFKNPHLKKKRPIIIIIITYGPKSLDLLYSIMNLNTMSLPLVVGNKANKRNEEKGLSEGGREGGWVSLPQLHH